jgi:hypothetical protein
VYSGQLGVIVRRTMRNAPVSEWIVIGIIALSAPLVGYWVHVSLIKYCYLWYARRFCRKNDLELLAWMAGYCFEESGGKRVKTEYTAFALDCRDSHGGRRVVNLLIGVFGVKAAFGLPGLPAEPNAASNSGHRLSVLWERGSGPPSVS